VLLLLMIPVTLAILVALLVFSAYAETHMVSSRALILRVAKSPGGRPEVAEGVVAREVERLLKQQGM
jgi:hypothetical protein